MSVLDRMSDESLAFEFQRSRDPDVFTELTSRNEGWVKRLIASRVPAHDCDDLYQDLMLTLWTKLDKFTASRNFKGWLKACVCNRVIDRVRRRKFHKGHARCESTDVGEYGTPNFVKQYIIEMTGAEWQAVDHHVQYREAYSVLRAAINTLPGRNRAVAEALFLEEMTYVEVRERLAESFAVPGGSLGMCVRQIRKVLKPLLDQFADLLPQPTFAVVTVTHVGRE